MYLLIQISNLTTMEDEGVLDRTVIDCRPLGQMADIPLILTFSIVDL